MTEWFLPKFIFTIILLTGIFMTSCTASGQNSVLQERMKNSPQYHNGKFHNKIKNLYDAGAAWRASLKEIFFGEKVESVPKEPLPIQQLTGNDFYIQSDQALRFVRIGHSTIMLQVSGKVWLTDPVFSERALPVQWIGPKRFHPVPIQIDELPPIEGVLISHNHYDHLDYNTILQLKGRVKHVLVPLGLGETLVSWGVPIEKITELDWWESTQIGDIEFISTPAQHMSGRGIFDADETLWSSWVIRTPQYSIFFSGDTGYFDGFKKIGEKYGPFDLTFLECGGYHQSWKTMHMMPEDNLKSFKDLKGKTLVPIHNGTFDSAFHPWDEPMMQVTALAKQAQVRILTPYMGQIVDVMNPPESVEWWRPKPKELKTGELAHRIK